MTSSDLFLPKPTLTGSLVELRPFNEQANSAMLDILCDPEVLIKTGSVHSQQEAKAPYPRAAASQWYATRNVQRDRLDLAVFDLEEQAYVGEVVFNDYSAQNKSVSYRIALGERGRGRGFGTEATLLMIQYGFEILGLNRIELEVYDFNKRARYVYASCGFVTEGRRRQALYCDGKYHDALIKSILRADWEAAGRQGVLRADSLAPVAL